MPDFVENLPENNVFIHDQTFRKIQDVEQSDEDPQVKKVLKELYLLLDKIGKIFK